MVALPLAEHGHSFATRERAQAIVAAMELGKWDPVLIQFGPLSYCSPGFIQGLLAALGSDRPLLVDESEASPFVLGLTRKILGQFGMVAHFV